MIDANDGRRLYRACLQAQHGMMICPFELGLDERAGHELVGHYIDGMPRGGYPSIKVASLTDAQAEEAKRMSSGHALLAWLLQSSALGLRGET